MKLILVGHGYWGKIWEKTIKNSDFELIRIIDPFLYQNCISDVNDNDYDGAIISIPLDYHYETAHILLKKNKKILIEKPCTHKLEDINKLIHSNNAGDNCGVGYILLYCSAIQKIKTLNAKWNYAHFFRSNGSSQIRTDCNVIYDLLCHDIALAYYMFEKFPKILFVSKNDDVVNCIIQFGETICYFYCARVDKQKLSQAKFINKNETYDYDDIKKELKIINNEGCKIEEFKEYPLSNQLEHFKTKFKADLEFGAVIHQILELI